MSDLPQTMFQFFMAGGWFAWLAALGGVVAIAVTLLTARRASGSRKGSVIAIAFSLFPLVLGVLGTLVNLQGMLWEAGTAKPTVSSWFAQDYCLAISISLVPLTTGVTATGFLIIVNLFVIAFHMPTTSNADEVEGKGWLSWLQDFDWERF